MPETALEDMFDGSLRVLALGKYDFKIAVPEVQDSVLPLQDMKKFRVASSPGDDTVFVEVFVGLCCLRPEPEVLPLYSVKDDRLALAASAILQQS